MLLNRMLDSDFVTQVSSSHKVLYNNISYYICVFAVDSCETASI